jgi:hypothetical protein
LIKNKLTVARTQDLADVEALNRKNREPKALPNGLGLTETTRNAMPSGRFDQIKVTFEIVVMSPRIL